LNHAQLVEIPDIEEKTLFFFEDVMVPKNKIILKLDIPELKVGEKTLSKNIRLEVIGNTHLCITSKNGVGKNHFNKTNL